MDSSSNLEGERFLVECLREDRIEVEWKLWESAGGSVFSAEAGFGSAV